MTVPLFIIGAVALIVSCIMEINEINPAFLVGAIGGALCMAAIVKDSPTALDVYQGKTTLEITYRDSIPVDSIVVFKTK